MESLISMPGALLFLFCFSACRHECHGGCVLYTSERGEGKLIVLLPYMSGFFLSYWSYLSSCRYNLENVGCSLKRNWGSDILWYSPSFSFFLHKLVIRIILPILLSCHNSWRFCPERLPISVFKRHPYAILLPYSRSSCLSDHLSFHLSVAAHLSFSLSSFSLCHSLVSPPPLLLLLEPLQNPERVPNEIAEAAA